jgi:O-antigen/teichoic acid export membrane protein
MTGKFSIHIVTFGVSIVLARLLSPDDFGLVAMAMVFVYFTQTFMDFGLTSAVIQKKDPTETQLSTVFYISVILGTCLMLLMIICAPAIGRYYDNPEVGKIVRFVSYSFIILALSGLQRALMQKRLEIKTLAVINIVSAVVLGASGVILAFCGFGAWSIVYSAFFAALLLFPAVILQCWCGF